MKLNLLLFLLNNKVQFMKDHNFWQGFYAGFAVVIITGFGDRLFYINMVFGSINNFYYGFWVTLAISEIMNLMNITLGELLKKYISISLLENIAIIVFCILGIWLIIKGIRITERRLIHNYEDERELLLNKKNKNNLIQNNKNGDNQINEDNDYKKIEINDIDRVTIEENQIGVFDSWWQYLITYFFASIGGKSQIASIIITTKYSFISIFTGTTIGILLFVFVAMLIGKFISKFLTNKQISIISGIFFLMYALVFYIDKKLLKNIKEFNE